MRRGSGTLLGLIVVVAGAIERVRGITLLLEVESLRVVGVLCRRTRGLRGRRPRCRGCGGGGSGRGLFSSAACGSQAIAAGVALLRHRHHRVAV